MRNQTFFVLSCTIAVIALCGCPLQNAALKARVDHNIDRCHQDFRAKFPIWRQCATNILLALSSANATTFEKPQFASAALGRDKSGEYRLYAYWIEDTPTVDSVELCLEKTNTLGIIPVSASDTERNLKDREVSVVFVASWIWLSKDSMWSKLESIDDVSKLQLRFLRASKPETEWHPVAFYRLDHWMGSKEVEEVTAGASRIKNN